MTKKQKANKAFLEKIKTINIGTKAPGEEELCPGCHLPLPPEHIIGLTPQGPVMLHRMPNPQEKPEPQHEESFAA
jgi:hypothetical protein